MEEEDEGSASGWNGENSEDEDSQVDLEVESWQQQLAVLDRRLAEIESAIEGEAGKDVGGEGRSLTGGNMQKRMLKLTEQREGVAGVEHDLNLILDSPLLQQLTDTHTPSPGATVVHSKAEVLHMRVQGVAEELDKQVLELQERMDKQREGIIADLEELEVWLGHTYSVVLQEPNRYLYPPGLVDEEAMRVRSEESSTFDEGEEFQQRRGSDVSGGSADVGGASFEGEREGGEGGGEELGGGEEGRSAEKEGGGDEEKDLGEEQERGVVQQEAVVPSMGVVMEEEEEEGDAEFSLEFSMSKMEDEYAEEEGDVVENGVQREEVLSPTSTHTETVTSGEGSSEKQSDETGTSEGLSWIQELRLLPQYHAPTLRKDLALRRTSVDDQDLEHLLSHLQKLATEMPIQSQKVKKVKANVNFVIQTLPAESASEYEERLELLESRWAVLEPELIFRVEQLVFEKAQKATLESILEAVHELRNQPDCNLLHQEIRDKHTDLMDYIISLENFVAMKQEHLGTLETALSRVEELCLQGEGEEPANWAEEIANWKATLKQFTEAYDLVTRKIQEQTTFLERCLEMWEEFEKLYKRSEAWLSKAERLVGRDTYGYTLKETETYLQEVKALHESIPGQEELGAQLVSLGKALLSTMEEGGVAEQFVDGQLSDVEGRLADLVTPHSGSIDTRETAVSKVLSDWRGYNGMLSGVRSFIGQLSKMVGPEPIESSNGNTTLLNIYITYASQIKQLEVQYKRLVSSGEALAGNRFVGSNANFKQELKDLALQWEPLKDNVLGSLEILIREYNDWIMVKLDHMGNLVKEAEDVIQREVQFIQNFPMETILHEDAEELLKEADLLVASQDQLTQMEAECSVVEEKLLEHQIQQETYVESARGSHGDLEYARTSQERERLQGAREKVQRDSDALQPVLNILYLQLQLLQSIQEGTRLVSRGQEFISVRAECESLLNEVEDRLTTDHFDKLKGQAFDAGAVVEEMQEDTETLGEQAAFSLPSCDKLLNVNKTLASEIDVLMSGTEQAKLRLQLLVQWWEDFESNHAEVWSWLEDTETSLGQLLARYQSTHPPRSSPIDLLKEIQELSVEVEERSVLVCALETTGQNLQEEMDVKGVSPGDMPTQITTVRSRWEELRTNIASHITDIKESAERFNSFLTALSDLINWLDEYHGRLYDEVCIQLPSKVSDELISRHKNQLEVFRAEVLTQQPNLARIEAECEEWAEHLVPETVMANLPSPSEPSPAPDEENDEFPPEAMMPYVRKHVAALKEKWASVQHLLQEREHQLMTNTGSFQAFTEHAQSLLAWLQGKLEMGSLFGTPPAVLEVVEGYQQEVESTTDELGTKQASLHALEHMASSLKGHVTPAIIERLDMTLHEAREKWEELEKGTVTRKEILCPLVDRLREYKAESSKIEAWLEEREAEFEACGTIGANLDRCIEQAVILEQLDEELLTGKQATERIQEQAQSLAQGFEATSHSKVMEWVRDHQQRYTELCESTAERRERCEEATAALQDLMGRIGKFEEWLEKMEEALEERKKEKRPIGTLQTVLDEHYEFMHDIETHTEDYLVLVPEGRDLMERYTPPDWLGEVMGKLKDRWFGYVDALSERCRALLMLLQLWEQYEKDVKELLGWIISEADSFSKDVTTRGDKGVVDHIQTCQTFMETLEGKSVVIEVISGQATALKEEDGEKKNGTSDVQSRWNDVQMHWNSCCKLLKETLLHLEATEAEMRHVLLIRDQEFEWLEECEGHAHHRERTHGNLELLQNETERHEQLLTQVHEHEEACQFIQTTVPFLVEHARKVDREEMKVKAEEFDQRYSTLKTSLTSHVTMLKDSVPFWKQFNANVSDLSGWLERVNQDLVSDNVQFGNAIATEKSLLFCQALQVEIRGQSGSIREMGSLGETLAKYVVPEDQDFVMEWVERLSKGEEHVAKETDEKTELLEERMKSWRVFPVEEARVVQEFLEQVNSEVEVGGVEEEEELTSDQLLEKLERLEQLQELQTSNEGRIQTIDKSSHSEDVQRALERNPDISKERTNLIQGWSNVSTTLKDKIALMRRKAEMMKVLERLLSSAEEGVAKYKRYLDEPLPPSVLLAERSEVILGEGRVLQNACQTCLSDYQNQLNQFDKSEAAVEDNGELQVPQRFRDNMQSLQEQYHTLSSRDQQRISKIAETLASWEEFRRRLEELAEWVRSVEMELAELRGLESFAMEFPSHKTRLQLVSEDLEEHHPTYSALSDSAPKHTEGEEPEVQDVLRKYTALKTSWTSLNEAVKDLLNASKPWNELTDRFDELHCCIEELEGLVEQEEEIAQDLDEAEGKGLLDTIVNFKDYFKRLSQQEDGFSALKEGVAKLLPSEACEKHGPCSELRGECEQLWGKWEELLPRVEHRLEWLHEKELAWKARATLSIRQLPVLQEQLHTLEEQLREKNDVISHLRSLPRETPHHHRGVLTRRCMCRAVGVVVVVAVATALFLVWEEVPPPL